MDFIKELIAIDCFDDDWTIDDIKHSVLQDYEDLIDLRNRIVDGTELYEEDRFTLDHVLDYMEILIKYLNMGRIE